MTTAEKSALLWLRNRNGDGVFSRGGVLLAAGELAGVMRATWGRLERAGLVERYDRLRLRVTAAGHGLSLRGVAEAVSVDGEA